jgi:hypothetical protein
MYYPTLVAIEIGVWVAASQPISVAGREIEDPASRFLSDRNPPDFFSPPVAAKFCAVSHPVGGGAESVKKHC